MPARMCLSEQKTRLARIRATKSWGANAYLQYKRNGLLGDAEEEVTVETARAMLCHEGLVLVHAHLLTSFHLSTMGPELPSFKRFLPWGLSNNSLSFTIMLFFPMLSHFFILLSHPPFLFHIIILFFFSLLCTFDSHSITWRHQDDSTSS